MTNTPRESPLAYRLLRIVLLVFGGQILVIYLTHVFFQSGEGVFSRFYQGLDYEFFHKAALQWLAGRDPYKEFGFVTPPVSIVVPSLLSRFSLDHATAVFLCCNAVMVPLALRFYAGQLRLPWRIRTLFLIAAVLFVSAQECVRGGNMDGIMLVLLVVAFGVRRQAAGAFWLGLSIVIKLYSIIYLAVLLRRRQYRFAIFTGSVALLLLLPFHDLWPSALHALVKRSARHTNVSIAPATLVSTIPGGDGKVGNAVCLAFWGITFAVALYRDREKHAGPESLARYTPWLLGYPALVYSYAGVLALTMLASLLAVARRRPLCRAEQLCFAGFLLLGIHVEQVTNLMPLALDTYTFFRLHAAMIQSCGVIMMMIGACLSPSERTCATEPELESAPSGGPQS